MFYISSNIVSPHQRKILRGVLWVDMTSHGTELFLVAVTRAFHSDVTGRIIIYR